MPYEIASLEGVMHGLYLLWWVQEKHTSPAVVAATLAAGELTILALEVPTGWCADRFGHRVSLIVGSLIQTFGMIACWLGTGVPGLIGATVLVGVGDCFRSGADEALLYRTCVALERDREFQSLAARAQAVKLAGLVALVLAGGAIVRVWGYAAGWIVETALAAAGCAIAIAMGEPPSSSVALGREDAAVEPRSRLALPWTAIARLVAPAALLGGVASASAFFAQTGGHSDAGSMTLLVAIITLAEAAGSAVAMRVTGGARVQRGLLAIGALCLLSTAVFPSAFIPVVIALAFLQGLAHPLRAAVIQRAVPDGVRAQAASLAHACDMAVNFMALPLAGVWQSRRRR